VHLLQSDPSATATADRGSTVFQDALHRKTGLGLIDCRQTAQLERSAATDTRELRAGKYEAEETDLINSQSGNSQFSSEGNGLIHEVRSDEN
jgi:hypothetical protein